MKPPRYDIHGQPLTTSIFSGDQTNSRFPPTSNTLHYSPKPGGQTPAQNHDKMNSTGSAIKYTTTTPVSKTTNSTHFTSTPGTGYSNLDTNRETDTKSTIDNNKKYNYTDNDSDNNNRNSTNNATLFLSTTASDSNTNSMKSTTNHHSKGLNITSSDTITTFTSQNKRQSSDDFVFDETDEALDNLLL